MSWKTQVGLSLDDVLQTTTIDVKVHFGDDVYQESLHNGIINYVKLYDALYLRGAPLVAKFERLFDKFNRQRQFQMETRFQDAMHQSQTVLNSASVSASRGDVTDFQYSRGKSNSFIQQIFAWWTSSLASHLDALVLQSSKPQKKVKPAEEAIDTGMSQISKELRKFKEVISLLGTRSVASILALEMANHAFKSISTHTSPGPASSVKSLAGLARSIGESIERAYQQQLLQEVAKKSKRGTLGDDLAEAEVTRLAYRFSLPSLKTKRWALSKSSTMSPIEHIELGTALVTLALQACQFPTGNPETGITVQRPAFWHTYELQKSKLVGVIKPNEQFIAEVSRNSKSSKASLFSTLVLSKVPPMLVKPRPWTNSLVGGYCYSNLPFLSATTEDAPEQYSYVHVAMAHNYMDKYLTAFNDLGQCAWAVNPKMLDVLLQIWDSGMPFLDIPGRISYDRSKKIDMKQLTKDDFNTLCERISLEYVINTAELFGRNGDRFYFSYKIDFRGRVYPQTNSSFWHMGPDHVRSLFMFWYGKPLGKRGLEWIKIHIATLFGLSKLRHVERIKFVDDHWADIVAAAKDPLNSSKLNPNSLWWTKADKPFQLLAACFDIVAAVESGDPENYVSRLCVAQDGTCNGLQHYAALGRDFEGAMEVNVVPQHKIDANVAAEDTYPRDIYSKVKDIVDKLVDKDIHSTGTSSAAKYARGVAAEVRGHITRKVVKRPVMTSVYGVTKYGIVQQVLEELKKDPLLEKEKLNGYSRYIGDKITEAYSLLFANAQKIQSWLEECADRICESVRWDSYGAFKESGSRTLVVQNNKDFLKRFVTSVIWTTPLGLPVVQPYRHPSALLVRTGLQTLSILNPFEVSFVNKMKQVNGIAPNFIHSLDSTHLLMTAHAVAVRAREAAASGDAETAISAFAGVHDSFWTHAASVDELNALLRAQFAELHAGNLVQELRDEFRARYAGYLQVGYIAASSEAAARIRELRSGGIEAVKHTVAEIRERWKRDGAVHLEKVQRRRDSIKVLLDQERLLKEEIAKARTAAEKKEKRTELAEVTAEKRRAREEMRQLKESWQAQRVQEKADISLKQPTRLRTSRGRSEASVLRHEMYQEYLRWDQARNPGEGSTPQPIVTPWTIIQECGEPVYRRPDARVPYGDAYVSKREPQTDTEGEEDPENEHGEDELEPASEDGPTRARDKKWVRVLVPLHIPKAPARGDFDIALVQSSDYFFS